MGKEKKKNLCKWNKKDISEDFSWLSKIVASPEYICGKCARAANSKKMLCKPEKIKLE